MSTRHFQVVREYGQKVAGGTDREHLACADRRQSRSEGAFTVTPEGVIFSPGISYRALPGTPRAQDMPLRAHYKQAAEVKTRS
jgi:hypothetical protein